MIAEILVTICAGIVLSVIILNTVLCNAAPRGKGRGML